MLSEFEKLKSDKKKKKVNGSGGVGSGGGGKTRKTAGAGKKKKRSPKVGDKGNLIDALDNLVITNQTRNSGGGLSTTLDVNLGVGISQAELSSTTATITGGDPNLDAISLREQWPPKPNETLRWEYELADEQAERARLETYKQNRRKRYVEYRTRMCRVKFDLEFDDQQAGDDDGELEDDDELLDDDDEIVSTQGGSRLAKNASRLFQNGSKNNMTMTTNSSLAIVTTTTSLNGGGNSSSRRVPMTTDLSSSTKRTHNDDSAISSLSSSNSPFL